MPTSAMSQYPYSGGEEDSHDYVAYDTVGIQWHNSNDASAKRRETNAASANPFELQLSEQLLVSTFDRHPGSLCYPVDTTSFQTDSCVTSSVYEWPHTGTSCLPQNHMGDDRSRTIPAQPYDHTAYPSPQQHFDLGHNRSGIVFNQQRRWSEVLTDSCELEWCLLFRDFLTYT
jgi:hypothetical protein